MSELDEVGSGMADPLKVRDFWIETVRGAADRGKLDTIPARQPRNLREKSQGRTQNHYLTRKSFGGFDERYDLIDWAKKTTAHSVGQATTHVDHAVVNRGKWIGVEIA